MDATNHADTTEIQTRRREKFMRGSQEGAFSGLLVIEALDNASLDRAVAQASQALPAGSSAFETYDEIFACHAPSIA